MDDDAIENDSDNHSDCNYRDSSNASNTINNIRSSCRTLGSGAPIINATAGGPINRTQ